MKKYTFELIIHSARDEFWENNPTVEDVRKCLSDALGEVGFMFKGDGDDTAIDELELTKLEVFKD